MGEAGTGVARTICAHGPRLPSRRPMPQLAESTRVLGVTEVLSSLKHAVKTRRVQESRPTEIITDASVSTRETGRK